MILYKEQFPELDSAKINSYSDRRRRRDVGNGISAKLNLDVSTKTTSKNQAKSIKVKYFQLFEYGSMLDGHHYEVLRKLLKFVFKKQWIQKLKIYRQHLWMQFGKV